MALTHLLKPLQIGKVEIKNRIARAAHGTYLGKGQVTEDLIAYYEARARSGVGLSIVEPVVVHPSSMVPTLQGYSDAAIPGLRRLAEASHRHGMTVFSQIWHGGHRWPATGGAPGISASSVPCPRGSGPVAFAMTEDLIEEIVEAFASTALRVQESGIDGVEIHCGHGYLIQQFLSPATNIREDAYGGSFENRMRFGQQVVRAVREAVGPDYPVGIRVSDSHAPGDLTPEDVSEFVSALCGEGLIDFVDASSGSPFNLPQTMATMERPAGYMLPTVRKSLAGATVPRMVTGRFRTLEEADQVLRDGDADLVSMVRAMIAEPDLVRKTLEGRSEEVRPCIACNQGCVAGIRTPPHIIGCTVNPAAGRELRLDESLIEKTDNPSRVVVVGGGPAGMEAARMAALSGHAVVLLEAQPDLGGAINVAKRAPKLQGIADITVWLESEIYRLGVDVRLSTYAEEEEILREEPDHVIIATGSLPRMDAMQAACPGVEVAGAGLPHVVSTYELFDMDPAALGETALVLDDVGHYEAIAAAEFFIAHGKKVTFVTRHSSFSPFMEDAVRSEAALSRLRQGDFTLHTRARLAEIGKGDCEIVYLDGGAPWRVAADTVALITYNEPNNEVYRALGGGTRAQRDFGLHIIGDANSPRDLVRAIHEGHMAGRFLGATPH